LYLLLIYCNNIRNIPTDTHEFSGDYILGFKFVYCGDPHITLPNEHIKRLKLDLKNIDHKSSSSSYTPPIIPNGIKYLEIKIRSIDPEYTNNNDIIVNLVRSIQIPSSIEILEIRILNIDDRLERELLEKIFVYEPQPQQQQPQQQQVNNYNNDKDNNDKVVVISKSRKLDNIGREENVLSTTTTKETESKKVTTPKQFSIPSSVKILSLGTVNNNILKTIPATVNTLVLKSVPFQKSADTYYLFCVDIPPNVDYVSIISDKRHSILLLKREQRVDKQQKKQFSNIFERYKRPLSFMKMEYGQAVPNETADNIFYLELKASPIELPFSKINSIVTSNINHLTINYSPYLAYKGYIPRSVRYLNICSSIHQESMYQILVPSSLAYIDIDESVKSCIQVIDEELYYYQPKEFDKETNNNHQLKTLVLPNDIQVHVPPYSLPYGIQELTISNYLITSSNIIPPTVKRLKINMKEGEGINIESLSTLKLDYLELNITADHFYVISNPQVYIHQLFAKILTYSNLSILQQSDNGRIILINSLKVPLNGDLFINVDKCIINCIFPTTKPNIINRVHDVHEIDGVVDVDKLPTDIKDLRLNYNDNVSLLSGGHDRFKSIPAFIQSRDLFFFIWRNTYLKKQIIHNIINPSGEMIEHSKRIQSTSTTLLINEPKSSMGYMKRNIRLATTNIIVDPRILTFVKTSIHNDVAELLNNKSNGIYHVHIKSKKIPLDVNHLIWTMNNTIPSGYLDKYRQLKSISFFNDFNQPILEKSIPDSVTCLRFGYDFQMDLEFLSFPSNLKELYLNETYYKVIKPNVLPRTLQIFQTLYKSNGNNDFSFLPSSCDHLILILPNLKYQHLDLTLVPSTVKYIKLIDTNKTKPGYGPNLSKIIYSSSISCFTIQHNIETDSVQLHKIDSNNNCNTISTSVVPAAVVNQEIKRINESINLHVMVKEANIKPNSLIHSIKSIEFSDEFNQTILPNTFPDSVETIIFGKDFNQSFLENTLPRNLKKLVFGYQFKKPINILKSLVSLEELEFGKEFNILFKENILPPSLKKLTFKSGYYNIKLLNLIPTSVVDLTFGDIHSTDNIFYHHLIHVLQVDKVPQSITKLTLSHNQVINAPSLIPSHIKHIRLGPCEKYDYLPPTIESLELGNDYLVPLLLNLNK